jgi:CheY-like chemotaxis protein
MRLRVSAASPSDSQSSVCVLALQILDCLVGFGYKPTVPEAAPRPAAPQVAVTVEGGGAPAAATAAAGTVAAAGAGAGAGDVPFMPYVNHQWLQQVDGYFQLRATSVAPHRLCAAFAAALCATCECRFDCILLDIMMVRTNGVDVAIGLLKAFQGSSTPLPPLIAMTANSSPADAAMYAQTHAHTGTHKHTHTHSHLHTHTQTHTNTHTANLVHSPRTLVHPWRRRPQPFHSHAH